MKIETISEARDAANKASIIRAIVALLEESARNPVWNDEDAKMLRYAACDIAGDLCLGDLEAALSDWAAEEDYDSLDRPGVDLSDYRSRVL